MGAAGAPGSAAHQHLSGESVEALSAAPVLQIGGAALADVSLEKLFLLLRAVSVLKYLAIRSGSLCVGALGKARAGRQQKVKLGLPWCRLVLGSGGGVELSPVVSGPAALGGLCTALARCGQPPTLSLAPGKLLQTSQQSERNSTCFLGCLEKAPGPLLRAAKEHF